MARIFHLAIAVNDIAEAVADYSERLGQAPDVVVEGDYALWRTRELNLSIRKTSTGESGRVRHVGWETEDAPQFTCDKDCNGLIWEEFTAKQQAEEIRAAWPDTGYKPKKLKKKKAEQGAASPSS